MVEDQYGNVGTKEQIVKVNGLPEIFSEHQVYTEGDAGIINGVETAVSAVWMKAADVKGQAAVETAIATPAIAGTPSANQIGYTINGPSTDFTKAGLYTITYTAMNPDGKTVSSESKVLIKPAGAVDDGNFILDASPFMLSYGDAKTLNQSTAKDALHGMPYAYKISKDAGGKITNIVDVTANVNVNTAQLKDIQKIKTYGGLMKLKFHVGTATKEVQVLVKAKYVNVVGNLVLHAEPFGIDYADIENLDEAKASVHANVSAYEIIKDMNGKIVKFVDISATTSIMQSELDMIHAADESGGIYSLDFVVSNGTNVANQLVQVFVQGKGAITDSTGYLTISGQGFTIENAEASSLAKSDVLSRTGTKATKINKDADGDTLGYTDVTANIKIDTEDVLDVNKATTEGGIFPVNISVSDNGVHVINRTMVTVKGTKTPPPIITPEGDELAITANDTTLIYQEAIKASEASVVKATKAKAYLIKSGKEMSVSIKAEDIVALRKVAKTGGEYEIMLSAVSDTPLTRAIPVTQQVKVKVTVLKESSQHPNISNSNVGTGDETNIGTWLFMLSIAGGYIIFNGKRKA